MTALQQQFKDLEKQIEFTKSRLTSAKGSVALLSLENYLRNLQTKQYEVSIELTAERHANNY